jgi:molybdopterin-guanine dinucleotide biosynthesis protein A
MKLLGVVMAGGRNTRYGGLKAFAEVGGTRIVDRVIKTLRSVTDDVVVIANDTAAYGALDLPVRSDEVAAGAALAGLLTALHWSEERKRDGIVTIACDMPFAAIGLIEHLVATAQQTRADVVVPASGGPRGVEPLCAWYSNRCAPAIANAIARDDFRMIGFYDDVTVVTVPSADVRRFGDPAVLFMNVNTREELAVAQGIADSEVL